MKENNTEKKYKLTFELVPTSCWYSNLRSALPVKLWDKIRYDAYRRANGACMICGKSGRLEAHEKWSYDDKKRVQTLEDVIALCPLCHAVKHIGRTTLIGKEKEAAEHFMKVNACSLSDYHEELGRVNAVHRARSRFDDWSADISWIQKHGFVE